MKLDVKPGTWEDHLTLFVGYLITNDKQSATVKSYISAIKAVLKMNDIEIAEDSYLLLSLIRACRLKNDSVRARFPIQRGMLEMLLWQLAVHFGSQLYLSIMYRTLFITTYYGLFRVSEVTSGTHPILARDVQIATNKKKMLFVLRSSKTHSMGCPPQLIKISAIGKCSESTTKQL